MYGDEFGAIGEGGFDLYVVDHFGNTLHHIFPGKQGSAVLHQGSYRLPVAGRLQQVAADISDGFGVIEFQATGLTFGRQFAGQVQE